MRIHRPQVTVRRMMLAVAIAGVLLAIGGDRSWRRSFCTQCGLRQVEQGRTYLGLFARSSIECHETEYARLYREFVSGACGHRWQPYSVSHSCRPGEVRLPWVLRGRHDDSLDSLRRLEDPARVATALASFNLSGGGVVLPADFAQHVAVQPALEELRATTTSADRDRWWARNETLFINPMTNGN